MDTLIGKKAPYFEAEAAIGGDFTTLKLDDYKGKYLCLFFYPLDFTFVCPTELHAFSERLNDFKERNCEVVAASVDSKFSHSAWLNTPKREGGIQGVNYPILADMHKSIARSYGTLCEDAGVAYRGLFLIDKEQIVRHATLNDLPLGRNVDEALRVLDALQFHEENGEVCPANWNKGDKAMSANSEGLSAYFSE